MKRVGLFIAVALLCACAGFAQENDIEDEDEFILMGEDKGLTFYENAGPDPAVPQSSPYGQHNTVSGERIKEQGSHDLLDALRDVPGVSFSKRNGIGGDTGTSLYIRGRGASHPSVETITNFDGVPRNGSIYGQSMPDAFSIGIADSVDIYKSPQLSAFGVGYALVDVVPRYMKTEGWEANAGLSLGSFLTVAETASGGYKKGAFDVFAAQSWTSTAGHTEHSAARQQSYYVNAGWAFNAHWNLRLLGNYVNARSERPRREGQSPSDILPAFKTNSFLSALTINNAYDKAFGFIKLYYSATDFYWEDENPAAAGDYSLQTLTATGVRVKETLNLWDGGEIIAGSDFDVNVARNLDHNENSPSVQSAFPTMFLCSPYIAAHHTFGKDDGFHFTPQAGARGFVHTTWANAFAPQAGFTAGYKNTDVFANYALGYVYPAPANIQNLVNAGGAGSADLKAVKPEVVYHYELGVSHTFYKKATIGGSFFYDDGRNRIIANALVPKNASLVSYFRITGVEFYGSVNPLKDLNVFAGGTWMTALARGEDGIVVNKMPFTPEFSFAGGFTWKPRSLNVSYLENVSIALDYRYAGGLYANTNLQFSAGFVNSSDASKLDDQHILHLRLSYALQRETWRVDNAEVFVDIDNVLNQKYEYWPGYPMPGISVMAGLNLKFK